MLKESFITKLAGYLKLDAAKIKAAIADEKEVDVELADGLVVYTPTELDTFQKNKYEAGKTAGEGMQLDTLITEHGVKLTGKKDMAGFLTEYAKKVLADANITVDVKVKEKDEIIKGLRANIGTLEAEQNNFKTQVKQSQQDSEILMWTADKKPDNLTAKEWVSIIKMNNELVEEGGQIFVKRDGKLVQDPKLLTNIPAKDAINSFIDERKLGKVATTEVKKGRGGENSNPGGKGKYAKLSELKAELESEGINLNGSEANARMAAAQKENPDMDLRS